MLYRSSASTSASSKTRRWGWRYSSKTTRNSIEINVMISSHHCWCARKGRAGLQNWCILLEVWACTILLRNGYYANMGILFVLLTLFFSLGGKARNRFFYNEIVTFASATLLCRRENCQCKTRRMWLYKNVSFLLVFVWDTSISFFNKPNDGNLSCLFKFCGRAHNLD